MNEMTVETSITIKVSNLDLYKELQKRIGVEGYKLVDGVLYKYDRVSWDDYDYTKVNKLEEYHHKVISKIEMLNHLSDLLGL
tara:strand:+ start:365 stop:610 length:246 start_codon:yes stop_codon:yes gene_type:complete